MTPKCKLGLIVIKALIYTSCLTLLVVFIYDLFKKQQEGKTSISVEFVADENLQLPSITFCSAIPFKNQNAAVYLEDIFVANTFKAEDIFDNHSLTNFDIKPIRSEFFGLCHTLTFPTNLTKWSLKSIITLKNDKDLKIFIHSPGDEFFLIRGLFPRQTDILDLRLESEPNGFTFADLIFKKVTNTWVNKEDGRNPCKDYPEGHQSDFIKCAIDKLSQLLPQNGIHCLKAAWVALESPTLPRCQNMSKSEAFDHHEKLGKIFHGFIKSPQTFGCFIPCTEEFYNPMLKTFFGQTGFSPGLFPYYRTNVVEMKKEYFIYDTWTILSSLGGTLGLLLGYSLLSVLLMIIEMIESKLSV